MKIPLRFCLTALIVGFALLSNNLFAQAPNISYSPSTNVYSINTAIPNLSPADPPPAGAVATFAYGPGTQLTGATLNNPYGMGIDPTTGNIYVANYGNNTVSKYNSAGTYQGTFGTGGAIKNPAGIVFDASGNAYILSYNHTNNGNGNHHGNAYVEQYNSAGVFQSTIISGLGTATGITIDNNNNLYIAEGSYNGGNQTVAQYNTSGALVFSLTSTNLTNPVGVAVDGSDNIYPLDDTFNDVTKFNSTGTYVSTVASGLGSGNALGIYADGSGDIYIGNSGTGGATGNTSGSVTVYNPSGTVLTSITGLNDPEGLVTDKLGNLYVSDYTNNTVTKYKPVGGYYLSGVLPPGLSFSSTTGVFSGTPTTTFAATTYTVTAYNASGSSSTTVMLSCPDTSTPTISYNPAINVFTINSAITSLTPTLSHSPTSFTISATLPAGLNFSTSTGIISGTPTVVSAATVYTITCTNANGSGSTTISIACVIDDFWTGASSNDWNTAGNWSVGVPAQADLASIGVIAYAKHGMEPSILASEAVSVYYLTFGATHAATLTVTGSLTINNILTINTNATPTFKGAGTINLVPAAVVNVSGTGALTITSPLTVTLQSDVTGSAQVSQMTTGSITGTVSVQRYISAIRSYRLLSSPVSTSATSGVISVNYLKNSCYVTGTTGTSGGFDAGVNNPSLYLFRENLLGTNASFTSGNYRGVNNLLLAPLYGIDIDSPPNYSIYDGNGYLFFFRGDRSKATLANEGPTYTPTATTLTATGTLNQGQITVKHWYGGSTTLWETTISGSTSTEGFNLVGNPYASSIDWDNYSTSLPNTTGIYAPGVAPFLYILMPNGNYNTYQANTTGGKSTGGILNSNIIPSGQGFLVQATGANPSITFNESAKTISQATGTNLFLGAPPKLAVTQYLHLLLAKDTVNQDGILVNFASNAKPEYVPGEDAPYKTGTGPASLTSISADNVALSINALQLPKQAPVIIPLNVNANADGTYQLNMETIKSVPQIYDIWLMDAYKKDSLDFRQNPVYSFDIARGIAATYGAGRFSLVIRQNPALGVHLLNFTANKATNGAQVAWKTENEQNYTNFTVEKTTDGGKTFAILDGFVSTASGTYSFLDKNTVEGLNGYRLQLVDLNGAISYSNTVNLMYGNGNNNTPGNITVYPNPVRSTINLAITQSSSTTANLTTNSISSLATTIPVGSQSYSIKIVNITGAVIKSATSTTTDWQDNVGNLPPGTYIIQVLNSKNNSLVGKTTFVKL